MRKNSIDHPSVQPCANGCAARRFFNAGKCTALYWILLLAISGILLALELFDVHHVLGLTDTSFWRELVVPFCREVELNFVSLYTSQISTTFLVTAFLSFLGDKNAPIYWTTAMEHKLVHPRGSSLKDMAAYSFFTLPISLLAILLQAKLCFVCFFLINILILSLITRRMIKTFYNRDKIKTELKALFRQRDQWGQQRNLQSMEENMVRAAHDHDIEYLRECKEFLEEFISDKDAETFKVEAREVDTCLQGLDAIAETCSAHVSDKTKSLEEGNSLGQCACGEAKALAAELKCHLTALYTKYQPYGPKLPNELKDPSLWEVPDFTRSDRPDQVTQQLLVLAEKIKTMADRAENPLWVRLAYYRTQQINDNPYHTSMLRYISIIPEQFAELQLSAMQTICRGIGLADLLQTDAAMQKACRDLHFEKALKNRRNIYIYTFPVIFTLRQRIMHLLRKNFRESALQKNISSWALDMLLAFDLIMLEQKFQQEIKGTLIDDDTEISFRLFFADHIALFQEAYDNRWAVDPYVQAIVTLCELIESGVEQAEVTLDRVSLFSAEEAQMLVDSVCSENARFWDTTAVYNLVEKICRDAKSHGSDVKERLTEIIMQSPQLGDDRGYLLYILNEENAGESK